MYDQPLFLQTLSRFAQTLPARYDLETVLSELAEHITAVFGLCGSGLTMADVGRLRLVPGLTDAAYELEREKGGTKRVYPLFLLLGRKSAV